MWYKQAKEMWIKLLPPGITILTLSPTLFPTVTETGRGNGDYMERDGNLVMDWGPPPVQDRFFFYLGGLHLFRI